LFFHPGGGIIARRTPERRGTPVADLKTDVRYVKGIGEQRAKALAKLGIHTLRDLISWFPRRYEDRTETRRIADLIPGETACAAAMVAAAPTVTHVRKGLDLVKLRAVDETGALDVTFFNQSWLKNSLRAGETYVFCGKAEGSLFRRRMTNPVVEPEGRREATGRIVPVYPLTAGVSQLILSRSVRQGLDACADILPDALPDEIRMEHQPTRTSTSPKTPRPWTWPGGGWPLRSCFSSPWASGGCGSGGRPWRWNPSAPWTWGSFTRPCPSP
jgi:ATP-dependent DNA helicase RecG